MSVINDMLRDLEHRRAPERAVITPVEVRHLIEPEKNSSRAYLLVIALLIFAGLGYGAWVLQKINEHGFASVTSMPTVENNASTTSEVHNTVVGMPPAIMSTENQQPKIKASVPPKKTLVSKTSSPPDLVMQSPSLSNNSKKHQIEPRLNPELDENELVKGSRIPELILMEKHPVLSPEALDQNNAEAALALFNNDDARIAYRQLFDFVAEHEYDSRSRAVLASYLLQDGRVAEAGDVLVAALIDQDADLRQLKARWFLASGDKPMALHTLTSRLPELATYPDYHALLASYYQQFGYSEKAAETYAVLIQYDANAANWWAGLGLALDSSGQSSNVVMAYQRALQLPGLNRPLVDFIKNRLQVLDL